MKTTIRLLLGIALVGTLAAILAANFQRDTSFAFFKWKVGREAPIEVKCASVSRARIIRTVEAPGKVEADTEVKISAQVVGRIVDLPVKEGDAVTRGKLVVQLDKVQYDADVRSAKARIQRLQASIVTIETDLGKSRRDWERSRRLLASHSISEVETVDYETVLRRDEARLLMAKADLGEAEAALIKTGEDLIRTTINSPINGIISQLIAKEGEVVVIGTMNNAGTVIMSISDPNTRVVRARVDENSIHLVREGQKTAVHLQNNDTLALTGTVLRISPKGIKPGGAQGVTTTGTNDNEVSVFETIIALDSPPPQVRLGMNANVEIQVDERDNVLSVPTQAVLHRQARDLPAALLQQEADQYPKGPGVKDPSRRYYQVVFVRSEGIAHVRLVKIGVSDESRVEILSGLEDGDEVIIGPYRVFEKLKDGKSVADLSEKEEAAHE